MRYTDFDYIVESKFFATAGFLHPDYRELEKVPFDSNFCDAIRNNVSFQSNGDFYWDNHDIGLIRLDRPTCIGNHIRPIK